MIDYNTLRNRRALASKGGQTLVEYAITLALISVIAIGVMINMGGQVKGVFSTVSSQMSMAGNGGAASGGSGGTGGTGGTGGSTHGG